MTAERVTIENPGAFGGEREGGHGLASVRARGELVIEDLGDRTRATLEIR